MRRTGVMVMVMAALAAAPALFAGGVAAQSASRAGFPYLHWPAAFVTRDTPVTQPVGHFRFWDGSALQDVEGHTYLATLVARDGTAFDAALLRRTLEHDLARMGATKVASGRVPASAIATINDADRKALAPGLGNVADDPVETWTLRRPHRQLWVQFTQGADQSALAVVEAKLN